MTDTNKSETFTREEAVALAKQVGLLPANELDGTIVPYIHALCNAAAQAAREKQEPVAEWVNPEQGFQALVPTASILCGAKLYTSPPVQAVNAEFVEAADRLRHALSNVLQRIPSEDWPKWLAVRDEYDSARRACTSPPVQAPQSIRVGKYEIRTMPDGSFWIEHESGEGMRTSAERLHQAIAKYYSDNF